MPSGQFLIMPLIHCCITTKISNKGNSFDLNHVSVSHVSIALHLNRQAGIVYEFDISILHADINRQKLEKNVT